MDGIASLLATRQTFTGNKLDRANAYARFRSANLAPDGEVSLIVVAGRDVAVRAADPAASAPGVAYDLQALLLRNDDPELDLSGEQITLNWTPGDGEATVALPLYLLGVDASARWTFALDVSGPARAAFLAFLTSACGLDIRMVDLRALLPGLSPDAAAIAGQAAALSQWHQTHGFCARCGAPTLPVEAGARRRCLGSAASGGGGGAQTHKAYPRTDAVVIMLVESPDGSRALLGRGAKSAPGMFTCLSGFVDQVEGVEEAVRREVGEETRLSVTRVAVLGTQPWPIGRAGSCELMIGCVARASGYEVMLGGGGGGGAGGGGGRGGAELDDAQWYDRAELTRAVGVYDQPGRPLAEAQRVSWESLGFFVPPPFAIAHHLIRAWLARPEGWWAFTGGEEEKEKEEDGGGGEGGRGRESGGDGEAEPKPSL